MGIEEFTLDEKYILRLAIEQLLDYKLQNPKVLTYKNSELKTVWLKVLKLIDTHKEIPA